jgi:hypothetical protein
MATRPLSQVDDTEEWRLPIAPNDTEGGDTEDGDTPIDRVRRILKAHAGGRAQLKLYRNRQGTREWCDDYTPAACESGGLAAIRDTWGPGEYEAVLYGELPRPGGKIHYGVVARESFQIAVTRPPTTNPAPAHNGELSAALQMIAQGQAQTLEALRHIAERPTPAPVDPMAGMMQMAQLFATMKAAFGPSEAPRSQISEIVAAMREIREVSKELNPDGSEPADPLTAALPGMLELIKGGMQQQQPVMMPPVSLPPQLAQPLRAPNPAPAPATPEPAPMTQEEGIAQLRAHLVDLVARAVRGEPVDEGAEHVYENAPEEVIDLLRMPEWFGMLEQFEPAVKPHKVWFENVGAKVLEFLAEDEAEEASQETKP